MSVVTRKSQAQWSEPHSDRWRSYLNAEARRVECSLWVHAIVYHIAEDVDVPLLTARKRDVNQVSDTDRRSTSVHNLAQVPVAA